jgi:DNA-binding PadR family transcriptional regulator
MASEEVRRSPLALIVLALLHTMPMHGYQVQLKLKQWGKDRVVNLRQRSSLYRTLDRLHAAGLVEVHATERAEQRPERTVYAITPEGEATLQAWQESMLAVPAREYPELPAALSVLAVVPEATALEALSRRVRLLRIELAQIEAGMAEAERLGIPRLFMVEEEYLLAVMRAELTYVEGLTEDIRSGALHWDDAWVEARAQDFVDHEATGGVPEYPITP